MYGRGYVLGIKGAGWGWFAWLSYIERLDAHDFLRQILVQAVLLL
jgi:hypothetical protein